jgi:hypothetical protein
MKHKIKWVLILAFILAVGFVILKITVPFSYAQADLNPPILAFVTELQNDGAIDPKECATRYLFFHTDYHTETPERIKIRMKTVSENEVRVTLYDPSCRDDSIHSSIDRIYLQRKDGKKWIPVRHECAHTGRGKFGWTTEPTS